LTGERLRVGIDARALCGRFTGDRTYWMHLIRALLERAERGLDGRPEYRLYARTPLPADAPPLPAVATVHVIPSANDRLWTMFTWPRALREDRMDVAHTQYTVPARAPCPVVTTIHDISFKLHPQWFRWRDRVLLNLTVPIALRRSARVITVSESSRRDIVTAYGVPESGVVATLLAAGPAYRPVPQETARRLVKGLWGLDEPYLLSVGVLQPRKNLSMLLEAYALARRELGLRARLVITGKRGWGCETLTLALQRLGIEDDVLLTGYVPDEHLPGLYSAALAFVYPSLYEGFGLPPLEAMACGCPALVSSAPAMPEVAGECAWLLPVEDPRAWAHAMTEIATDGGLRERWSALGRTRSGAFRWDRTAALTARVYAEAAAARRPCSGRKGVP